MPRRREVGVKLPPDVHTVTAKGRAYFYHQTNRNTPAAGKRSSLGSDPALVWEEWRKITGATAEAKAAPDSFSAMVDGFKASPEWAIYAEGTQRDYEFYLDKMTAVWGPLAANTITPAGVLTYRDTMADSPGSANHMLSIGKTLFKWGVPRAFATANPFREVAPLADEDDGHRPWPQWALDFIAAKAWPDLARFVYLALHTGQRESDVVRMGKAAREGRGMLVRPRKTRKRRQAFFVPLLTSAAAEIDRWETEPLEFIAGRWKQIVQIQPGECYVLSPAGNPYTPEGLRSRWNRWLETEDGKALLARWTAWERAQRERDGEDMEDGAAFKPTLHGLRATAVVARRLAGYTHQQISNDIGMSIPMVTRYSRFMDQREAAETNIVTLEEAVDRRRRNAL